MSEGPTIRLARPGDRDLVIFFHRLLYVEHKEAVTPTERAILYEYRDLASVLRADVDALLRNPDATVWLAIAADKQPVGYISGHVEHDPRRTLARKGVVEDWYVCADARRQGLGTRLFDTLVGSFREQGCQMVESATWPTNTEGRAAHGRLGFLETQIQYRMLLDET